MTTHSHGSIGAATACLLAAMLGLTSAATSEPSALPHLVSAVSPDQVREWSAVGFDVLNKLFAAVNVAIGLYHGVLIVKRRSVRKPRAPKPPKEPKDHS